MKTHTRLTLGLLSVLGLIISGGRSFAQDKVDFEKQILPVLKAKCFKCHEKEHTDETGKVKKPKSGLVMDSAAGIKKGGKEDEKFVVAGKSAESTLVKSIALPESDDLAMPPEGKGDRVTKAEQDLIKKWIDEGASFGAWKGKE